MTLSLILGPLALTLAALALAVSAPPRGGARLRLPEAAALLSLAGAAGAALALWTGGPSTSELLGIGGLGLSLRLDLVSVTMALLVSFVGWVVLRFAAVQTDGEPGQARFLADLCLALAAVLALTGAGNLGQLCLAWVALGILLRRLLLFYPQRPAARRAARKKALSSLVGSAALIAGCTCLAAAFASTDIATIAAAARASDTTPVAAILGITLLAVAALLKSALMPAHGWLTEVMEAPTPVSALLHAGVVNAGGVLLIRFADVLVLAPGVMAALALAGGFTALCASVVMLTQPAIKTALAWSTAAQMGFMVLQCGLGLFGLALLHIVAHSLYKAHAFLSSGGAVEAALARRRPGPVATPRPGAILIAFTGFVAVYAALATGLGGAVKSPQSLALGTILVFGVAYLLAQGLADAAPRALGLRTAALSALATLGYFGFQTLATVLSASSLPAPRAPDPLEWVVLVLAVAGFGAVALAQTTLPLWQAHPAACAMRVHLANGLYLNALLDRVVGGRAIR